MSWPLALYFERLRGLGRAPATVHRARTCLQRFLRFCARPLAEVTAAELVAYRFHLEETPTLQGGWRAPGTVAGELLGVRSFLRWALSEGFVLVDPTRHLVIKTPPRPLPRLLTVDQVERLLAVPGPATVLGRRDRALLETLYGLGLRAGECLALDLADLAWNSRLVWVRPGKNRRARMLPLGDQLARVLAAYLEESRPVLARRAGEPALFLSMRGRRLSKMRLAQIVTAAADELGLHVSCHSLRHACATHLLAGGAHAKNESRSASIYQSIISQYPQSRFAVGAGLALVNLQFKYQDIPGRISATDQLVQAYGGPSLRDILKGPDPRLAGQIRALPREIQIGLITPYFELHGLLANPQGNRKDALTLAFFEREAFGF